MTAISNILLSPLCTIYGTITRTRNFLFRKGILTTHNIAAPVISVGNITTGGTGKTPLVDWLARRMAAEGEHVCILTRGYGRAGMSQQVLVSDRQNLLASAVAGGDEPRFLAESLLGVAAVVSNADRVSAARWAIDNLKSTLFILDDGFQHLSIARDLNLVTIDATNPWGAGRLLPAGRLREPLRGLARADAILLTRAELSSDIDSLRSEVYHLSKGRPILTSQTRTLRIRQLTADASNGSNNDAIEAPIQPVAAFCALGNPEAFFAHVRSDGLKIVHAKAFKDHHTYIQSDIDDLHRAAIAHGASGFVTTAKDAVKLHELNFDFPCYVVDIELVIEDEAKLIELLRNAIRKSRVE
jgi:tetraacyldisaccharide 4'-kinase